MSLRRPQGGHRRVSVIVPSYNRASFLESTLGSIFGQTVPVHEVLLVDDGSVDGTRQLVGSLLAKHPAWNGRLRYFLQDNLGKSVALNVALAAVTGDWIAFNDSDDWWLPRKLELQFEALDRHPEAGACFTDSHYVNNAKFQKTAFEERELNYTTEFGLEHDVPHLYAEAAWSGIFMQTVLVRREIMDAVGPFDPSLRMSMDADFVFRLGLVTPMCFVNHPLVEIDRTPGRRIGLMTQHPIGSFERLEVHEYLQSKWLSLAAEPRPDIRQGLLNGRSCTQSELANRYLLRGDFRTSRRVLLKAIRQNPMIRLVLKLIGCTLAPGLVQLAVRKREERSARKRASGLPVPQGSGGADHDPIAAGYRTAI